MGDLFSTDNPADFEQRLEQARRERIAAESALTKSIEEKGGLFAWIFKPVGEFFKAQFSAVWSNWVLWFGPFFKDVFKIFDATKWVSTGPMITEVLGNLKGLGLLDDDDVAAITAIIKGTQGGGILVMPLLTMMILGKSVGALGDVIGGTVIQRLNKSFSPSVPSANDVLNVSFIAPELHAEVIDVLKRNGYSDADIKLMFVGRYALHPPGDIGEMFTRGILTEDQADNALRELGYTDERVGQIKQVWKRIPTLQDVVRYLGKEAFEPDKIAKYGLMANFPEESVEWAAKQGLERRWAEAEWIAHWRDPGLTPYLDAFHREQVTWAEVQDYMSLIEIAPGLQKVIKDTAYNVYTRVDVRRMYQLGVMNEDQVFKAYKEMGYDPEKAFNLTKFTIIDVASEDQPVTRTDILNGFKDGDLTTAEAEDMLEQIGYKRDRAEYLIYREQRAKEKEARDFQQKLIQDRFVSGIVDEAGTRNALFAIGLTAARVSELMGEWGIAILKAVKLPSKTDLDKMFRAQIITEKTYVAEMARLGYSEQYRNWYLDMIKRGIES